MAVEVAEIVVDVVAELVVAVEAVGAVVVELIVVAVIVEIAVVAVAVVAETNLKKLMQNQQIHQLNFAVWIDCYP